MTQIDNAGRFLNDNTMVWERQLSVEPGRLWSAIATREGLSHWFMSTKFEITEGGSFSFEGGWDGTISEIEPYRHIQFNVGDDNGGWLRFVIDADDDGCLFSLIDRMGAGISPDKMKGPDTPRLTSISLEAPELTGPA